MKEKSVRDTGDEKLLRVDFENLNIIQGELKTLSKEAYAKLKKSILKHGFFAPFFVWNDGKQLNLLDGTQRKLTLLAMKEEGYSIPKLPAVLISAKNLEEAKEKLLVVLSQFGKVADQGLYEFIQGMDYKILMDDFDLPNLDTLKFMDNFFNNDTSIDPMPPVAVDSQSNVGNGVKMLQLFFSEKDHEEVMKIIESLQETFRTENATDTVMTALKFARENN
jgi:hypothetical protein